MGKILKYAFRITHIDNIPHILKFGLLLADSSMRDEKFVSIGDPQVINIRKMLMVGGQNLRDYVPFYLGPRTPMLYVIQHGYNGVRRQDPAGIVYCVLRLADLIRDKVDCFFTDGHALSALTKIYEKDRLPEICQIINYDDVYVSQWNNDSDIDLKRRKEAELLIKGDVPPDYIRGYIVYNDDAKEKLKSFGIAEELIVVAPNYYF